MQIITKEKRILCQTAVHYPAEIVQQMKRAGYKVTEAKEGENAVCIKKSASRKKAALL